MAERQLIVKIVGDASSIQRSFSTASRSSRGLERDLGRASRGSLAGSGAFRSLGRSLAFASGGFLAFGGAAAFLRKTVDAAKEAQVANAQLATQLRNSGQSFATYRGQIDATVNRLSALAGIQDDELKAGLTTILRTVPNVSKALRDLGTAADLSRAKHISLAQAALIIAKTEAGNTTLLRRQGFQIAKNATVEQALAVLRQRVAGQARAGTTEQERFGAVLHHTEEIIGTALLPTLNKFLISGTKWLEQMNRSGKLQKDVSTAAHDFATAMDAVKGAVEGVDKVTGSFKHTLELLLALKFASVAAGWVSGLQATGGAAVVANGKVGALRTSLSGLGALQLAPIIIPVGIKIEQTEEQKIKKHLGGVFADAFSGLENIAGAGVIGRNPVTQLIDASFGNGAKKKIDDSKTAVVSAARAMLEAGKSGDQTLTGLEQKFKDLSQKDLTQLLALAERLNAAYRAAGGAAVEASVKARHGLALAAAVAPKDTTTGGGGSSLTAAQRNTFFDNDVARILRRGGFGNLQQQLAAIDKASGLIQAKLKTTRDKTRRLNLQDQVLELAAQKRDIKKQIAQNVKDRIDAEKQAAKDLAQKRKEAATQAAANRLAATSAREFRQLGLSATGDAITPGVANLQKRVKQIAGNIAGTSLDTPKLEAQLARFRKVLSEGLVPKDVRAKIKEMLDAISDEIKNAAQTNQTKFRHISSVAIANSIPGLTPDQKRKLEQLVSQVGAGGTVPQRSAAFGKAGAQTVVVNSPVYIDGKLVSKNVTKHQQTASANRSSSRRGPYAGRH